MRQTFGKSLRGSLIWPAQAFYNGGEMMQSTQFNSNLLLANIQAWGRELAFSQIGVADVDLSSAEPGLLAWLEQGFHGDMDYMARHGLKRARPAELVPGTLSVLTARMDYLPSAAPTDWQAIEWGRLNVPEEGVVSIYARGRDYHKVLRSRLQKLAEKIATHIEPLGYRVFTDSAPVLEAELAARSGQGWRGKHTLLLNRQGGSMFFLGEIYLNVALPPTAPQEPHCGTCKACIDVCPTQAIVAPYRLDARRCISYLTIELRTSIPLELRPLMGNRVFGCDDCQLCCPWNKFSSPTQETGFTPRHQLDQVQLVDLFNWSEDEFLRYTEGSAIRRIGYECWLRNLAVGLGNAPASAIIVAALQARLTHPSELVREHVEWALTRQSQPTPASL